MSQGLSKHNTKNGGKWKWRNMEKTKNIKIKPSSFGHVNRWRGWIWVSPESEIGEWSWPAGAWRWADRRFLELTCWSLFLCFAVLWVWEKEMGRWDELCKAWVVGKVMAKYYPLEHLLLQWWNNTLLRGTQLCCKLQKMPLSEQTYNLKTSFPSFQNW